MAGVSHVIKMSAISSFFAEEPRTLRRGEDAVESNHIKSLNFDGDLLMIRGEVWASQRTKFYAVELTLDNEFNFQEASCTCPRGQYLCHHMAALCLYAHYNVSSTQVTCRWNNRRSTADSVVTIQELYKPSKPDFKATKRNVNAEDKQWLADKLKAYDGSVGFTWLLKPEILESEPKLLPDIEEIFFSEDYLGAEDQRIFLMSALAVTEQKIIEVSTATEGQSANVSWLLARKHRLTASNFGKILAAIKRNSYPASLFRTLTESYDLDSVKAIQWGRTNEKDAVNAFNSITQLSAKPTGIWLDKCGFLGASPDGIIDDDSILEIKCPYKYRASTTLSEDIKKEKKYIISYDKVGEIIVNKEHDYYHQIQGQLYFTNRKFCYLMIWTPNSNIIVTIPKNPDWEANINLLKDFYFNYYIQYVCGLLDSKKL